MKRLALIVGCLACGSSNAADGGTDATADVATCDAVIVDASYTCDVSSVSEAARACNDWAGIAPTDDAGAETCDIPSDYGWSGGGGRGMCMYSWDKPGPPDLCALPASSVGGSPFSWLAPTCDAGCP